MHRIAMPEGKWFDADAAKRWEEDRYHDGNNYISCATGSQWEHQRLYLTAKGRWVLCSWSDWQGSVERHREVKRSEAALWLVRNNEEPPESLLEALGATEI